MLDVKQDRCAVIECIIKSTNYESITVTLYDSYSLCFGISGRCCTLTIFKCGEEEILCVGTIAHSESTHTAEVGVEWVKSRNGDISCGGIEHQYSSSVHFSDVDLVLSDDSIV